MFCGYFKQAAPSALLIVLKYSPVVQLRHSGTNAIRHNVKHRVLHWVKHRLARQTPRPTIATQGRNQSIALCLPSVFSLVCFMSLHVITHTHTHIHTHTDSHTQTVTYTHISSHTVLQYEVLQILFCTHERFHKKRFEICEHWQTATCNNSINQWCVQCFPNFSGQQCTSSWTSRCSMFTLTMRTPRCCALCQTLLCWHSLFCVDNALPIVSCNWKGDGGSFSLPKTKTNWSCPSVWEANVCLGSIIIIHWLFAEWFSFSWCVIFWLQYKLISEICCFRLTI